MAGIARDIRAIKDDVQGIKDDIQGINNNITTIKDDIHSIQEQTAKHAAEQKNIAVRTTNHTLSPTREGKFKVNPCKTVGLLSILT